jgi:O-methyltransferase involved in polyketide biosynthesis
MNSRENLVNDEKYREIIPTAILTAYPRTFSDIPYSQEIFDELQRHYGEIDDSLIVDRLAVELEARSKLIDRLLAETGASQVLEIAAGFSSRGLVFAAQPDTQYVELDLPDLAELKTQIVGNIAHIPENLHILGGNALRLSDFDEASQYFDTGKPVVVVNEGLLRYLTFDEKAQVASNIRGLLERFGGIWISGDGATKSFRDSQNKNVPSVNTTLMNTTKRNNVGNAFESQEHFREFFGNLGFTVEFHSYTEVQSELSSPQRLGLTSEEVSDKLLAYASAIVFKLKD